MPENFGAHERAERPSLKTDFSRAAILATLLSAGCASQVDQKGLEVPKRTNTTTVSPQWAAIDKIVGRKTSGPEIPPGSMVITGKPPKAKKNASDTCVFTGVVLIHDQYSNPPKILLENRCLPKGNRSNYEGQHKWIEANSKGRYKIPFYDSYVEEKQGCVIGRQRSSCLTFVADQKGKKLREDLAIGLEPGTFTFEYSLDNHSITPIVR